MEKISQELLDYIYDWDTPVEVDFFGEHEKERLTKEGTKLNKTYQYLIAVQQNPTLGAQMEKDIATGVIYSQGEINKAEQRIRALTQTGDRVFPDVSLVAPSGQRIITSRALSDAMGLMSDGFIPEEDLEDLILELKHEGVLEDQIQKVRESMRQYHAIVAQRGAYEALFDLLEESSGYELLKKQYAQKDQAFEEVKETFENQTQDHGLSIEALKAAVQIPIPPRPVAIENTPFAYELKREVEMPELPVGTDDVPKPVATKIKAPEPVIEHHEIPMPRPPVAPKLAPLPKALEVPRAPAHREERVPMGALKSLMEIRAVDDLKKIRAINLRQGELSAQIGMIKAKILAIAQANKLLPFYTVSAFEDSPLYKNYMQVGSAMIVDPDPDRAQAFEKANSTLGDEKLSMREFEAIADLKKQIEQL